MRLLELANLDSGPGAELLAMTVAQGFSEAVARDGLKAEFEAWSAPGALAGVKEELRGVERARIPTKILVIAAGTLPASALRQVLMGRILGAQVLLKPASGQESFAELLAQVDPDVRPCPFESSDGAALDAALERVQAVAVLGSDRTIEAVRRAAAIRPGRRAFVGYGHKVSAAWLPVPTEGDLAGLTMDLMAWDQAGCLSPQVLWTDQPQRTATALAAAIEVREGQLPMTLPPAAARAHKIATTRALMSKGGGAVATKTATIAWQMNPTFIGSPGHRFLWVLPTSLQALHTIDPILSTLACISHEASAHSSDSQPWRTRTRSSRLKGLDTSSLDSRPCEPATATSPASRSRIDEKCRRATTSPPAGLQSTVRRCAPGEMQRPPLSWQHDGKPNLLPLLLPSG